MRELRCDKCRGVGIKLWRQWNTFADSTALLCAPCLDREVDANGFVRGTDQISSRARGIMIPAVPVQPWSEYQTFWVYTSVPAVDVAAWRALPSYLERYE